VLRAIIWLLRELSTRYRPTAKGPRPNVPSHP
jgi:hypothetical protein